MTRQEFIQKHVDKANYFIARGKDARGFDIQSPRAYMAKTIENAQQDWARGIRS